MHKEAITQNAQYTFKYMAFDQVDVLNKAALIYEASRNMGFVPEGMSDEQMNELKEAFNL